MFYFIYIYLPFKIIITPFVLLWLGDNSVPRGNIVFASRETETGHRTIKGWISFQFSLQVYSGFVSWSLAIEMLYGGWRGLVLAWLNRLSIYWCLVFFCPPISDSSVGGRGAPSSTSELNKWDIGACNWVETKTEAEGKRSIFRRRTALMYPW